MQRARPTTPDPNPHPRRGQCDKLKRSAKQANGHISYRTGGHHSARSRDTLQRQLRILKNDTITRMGKKWMVSAENKTRVFEKYKKQQTTREYVRAAIKRVHFGLAQWISFV